MNEFLISVPATRTHRGVRDGASERDPYRNCVRLYTDASTRLAHGADVAVLQIRTTGSADEDVNVQAEVDHVYAGADLLLGDVRALRDALNAAIAEMEEAEAVPYEKTRTELEAEQGDNGRGDD